MKAVLMSIASLLLVISIMLSSCSKSNTTPKSTTVDPAIYLTSAPWVYSLKEIKQKDSSWISVPFPAAYSTYKAVYNPDHTFIITSGTAVTKLYTSTGTWQLLNNNKTLSTTVMSGGTTLQSITKLNASTLQLPLVDGIDPTYPYQDPITNLITFYYGARFTFAHP